MKVTEEQILRFTNEWVSAVCNQRDTGKEPAALAELVREYGRGRYTGEVGSDDR